MRICLALLMVFSIMVMACAPAVTTPTVSNLRIIAEEYPPLNFIDKNNNVVGQSTEIVQAIMQKLNIKASIEVLPLAQGLTIAESGPNVAIFSINRTQQREAFYKWVGSIGHYQQAFYAKKGSNIVLNRLEDAKNVGKIGVYKGDAGNQFLVSQGFSNLDESQTDSEALKKLMDNKVQLWLGNVEGLAITAKQAGINPDDLVIMPTVVVQADLYIAFSQDVSDSTILKWQKALDFIKKDKDIDGKTIYDKIRVKYDDAAYIQSIIK